MPRPGSLASRAELLRLSHNNLAILSKHQVALLPLSFPPSLSISFHTTKYCFIPSKTTQSHFQAELQSWTLSSASPSPCVPSCRRRHLRLCAPFLPRPPVAIPLPVAAQCQTCRPLPAAAPLWARRSPCKPPGAVRWAWVAPQPFELSRAKRTQERPSYIPAGLMRPEQSRESLLMTRVCALYTFESRVQKY